MQNRGYNKNGFEFIRIDKKKARRAYNNNLTVIFCPVNLSPFSPWGLDIPMNKENINCNYQSFETILNEFEFYNCNNETGKYTAFYIPVKRNSFDGFQEYDYKYLEV